MSQRTAVSNHLRTLPRGGCIVDTPVGQIQIGAPPETIKDTIVTEASVPRIFVLPCTMFNWSKGINVADMEFPIYFNFFLKQQKVTIVGTEEQGERLRVALREAVFGPESFDLRMDTFDAGDDIYVPDIRKELEYFKGSLSLEKMYEFIPFQNGEVTIEEVTIKRPRQESYEISWKGQEPIVVPGCVEYVPTFDIGNKPTQRFNPPRFGVTCLGPSHGFDPNDNTSGFIIWLNRNGIMVDPPVNSTEWLLESNVNPKLIDSIILTHCHADHDAGTFQKILEEGRVAIYTTKTIMNSFLRKYSAFSGEDQEQLKTLFEFRPVYMGRPFYLHGGEFQIQYSVHSIPTMGFRLSFQGRSFVYSSDHQGDPEVQKEMLQQGVIDERRLQQLRNFPWDSDVIYHESGIAPLHTPLTYLNSLPEEIQKKIVVYHISHKDFLKVGKTKLRHAEFGVDKTLYFDANPLEHEKVQRILDVLKRIPFLRNLPVGKVQEFLNIAEWHSFKAGDYIIQEGTRGDTFFIIVSGSASITTAALDRSKRIGAFEYFGEVAILTNSLRTADIVAETDVETLLIRKNKFLAFISGTEFENVLMRLIKNRSEEYWNLMVHSPVFSQMTDYQKMWLESCFEPKDFHGSGVLIEEKKQLEGVYVIREGIVEVFRNGKKQKTLKPGELVGEMISIQRDRSSRYTFSHRGTVRTLFIPASDVRKFVERNPGIAVRTQFNFTAA
ncbi:MAG: cAMP/cGMP-dependent 3',5'-cyclic-AMP/GMP phosphodiesterase [Spirochaetaceae bacterium]